MNTGYSKPDGPPTLAFGARRMTLRTDLRFWVRPPLLVCALFVPVHGGRFPPPSKNHLLSNLLLPVGDQRTTTWLATRSDVPLATNT